MWDVRLTILSRALLSHISYLTSHIQFYFALLKPETSVIDILFRHLNFPIVVIDWQSDNPPNGWYVILSEAKNLIDPGT